MKRLIMFLLVTCTVLSQSTASFAADYEKLVIRCGSIYNEETTQGLALNRAKDIIERESGGNITVDIFHGSTLGTEKDQVQGQKEGSLEMMFSGTAGIGLYIPASAVFEAFFAFNSIDELHEAFVSLSADLDSEYQRNGFKLLGAFYDGPRHILSNVKVTSFEELKGVKLRAPGAPIYVNSITALGAQAVAMPLGDVYTALQTGAVDAMELALDQFIQQKFYEQGKYVIEDAHVFQPLSITYNLDAWTGLSPAAQQLIQDAVNQCMQYQRELHAKNQDTHKQQLIDAGIEFIPVPDREKWIAAVKQVSEDYAKEFGDLGKKIYEVIKSYQQ